MFDKLVLSSADRRQGRTGKIFFVTSLFYSLAIASALVVSVVAASPALYEKVDVTRIVAVPPMLPPPLGKRTPSQGSAKPQAVPRPDIYHPERLDDLVSRAAIKPIPNVPIPPSFDLIGNPDGTVPVGDPNEVRNGIGPIGGNGILAGNPNPGGELPPPVQKPVEKLQPPVEKPLVKLTSTVLTGRAIERKTPVYPPLAKQVHAQGAITVEIFISADGRVESARALGGHPLLMSAAAEAARGWRFQPTLLNGTAVRVTGVITFNFKLD
ncbi:MAG: TonB family protein [Acidobacteria bacterium]|nr:TonB family protein [Acidobacteriota bacterium]